MKKDPTPGPSPKREGSSNKTIEMIKKNYIVVN
jgi:hypothetical protein